MRNDWFFLAGANSEMKIDYYTYKKKKEKKKAKVNYGWPYITR